MPTLQDKIEDYVGTVSDTASLTEWLKSGIRILVDIMPEGKAYKYSADESVTTSGLSVVDKKLLKAHKEGYGCRFTDSKFKARIQDATSLYYANSIDPVAILENGKIYIYPNGGSATTYQYPTVTYSTASPISNFPLQLEDALVISVSIKVLANKLLTAITEISDAGVTAIPVPTFTYTDAVPATITEASIDISLVTLPTYTKPALTLPTAPIDLAIASTAPTAPSAPSISYTDATGTVVTATGIDISLIAKPTYTEPALALTSAPSDLAIATTLPTPPIAPSLTYTDVTLLADQVTNIASFGTTPTYVGVSASLPTVPTDFAFSADVVIPTAPSEPNFVYGNAVLATYTPTTIGALGTAPVYTKPTNTVSFTDATTYIGTDEDIEKSQAELSKENTKLELYGKDLYNELNEFNGELEVYKLDLQKVIRQADLDQQRLLQLASETTNLNLQNEIQSLNAQIQSYKSSLELYQVEISNYGQIVQSEVTEYATNLDKWKADRQTLLTKYQLDIQDSLNSFNAELDIYKANVQKELEQARLNQERIISRLKDGVTVSLQNELQELNRQVKEYELDLGKYSAELNGYQSDVNTQVTKYKTNLEKWIAIRNTELQKYSADIQNELNTFNKEATIYQAEIQNKISVAQLLQQKLLDDAQRKDNIALANELQTMQGLIADYQATLQKYGTDIQLYNAKVNTEVTQYAQNFAKWQATSNNALQQYSLDIQNELNEYGKELEVYRQNIAVITANAQLLQQVLLDKAQRTDQIELTNKVKEFERQLSEYANKLQKYQLEINKYATDIQAKTSKVQSYIPLIQTLKAEYNEILQGFING